MIYFISGLGADKRVFQFLDLPNCEFQHIYWEHPSKGETLSAYATRLIKQINQEEEVILIGVSFGGMLAQEMAKQIRCKKVIIISSVKSPKEFDWKLRLARRTKIHQLVPSPFFKWSNLLAADYFFGVKNKETSKLLTQIVKDTDTGFLVWAIDAIMRWENPRPLEGIVHIHGTTDRIFPKHPINQAHWIEGGGHFMVVSQAKEVSRLILNALKEG